MSTCFIPPTWGEHAQLQNHQSRVSKALNRPGEEQPIMALHRFAVGQSVEFVPGRFDATATRGVYTVVRLHASDREYRVRNARDGHKRVVRESQIRLGPHAVLD